MAVRYSNNKPVLLGRTNKDNVHPYKGTVEKYSNYSIYNESNVLDVEPKTKHIVGEGPSARHLARVFAGFEDGTQPLEGAGEGPRPHGDYRFRPHEFRGVDSEAPLRGSFGHGEDTPVYEGGQSYSYSNFKYDGLEADKKLVDVGHPIRSEGGAATFGRFDPYNHHGKAVGDQNPLQDDSYGSTLPEDRDNPYGKNKVLEWNGLESDKAIF